MEIPENESNISFLDTPFGKKSFVKESSIIQLLVERVQQQPSVFKELVTAIEQSKTNSNACIAATNAITILVHARVQFNGANLRGINIPGADLSFGVFDSAQLQGANIQNANLRNIWLRQANLDEAHMDGVQFGELPFLKQDSSVECCAYSSDGNGHSEDVRSVVYSPKGDRIASGSEDETVRLWDVDTGKCVYTLQGHSRNITSVVYSPKGDRIASGSYDYTVRLWDVESGQCKSTISGFNGVITSLALESDSGSLFLVTGSSDKSVRRWKITKEVDEYKSTLCWSSTHEVLTVTNLSVKDVHGLKLDGTLLVEALNFKIVRGDEFRTSIVCCQCKNAGTSVHSIRCVSCHMERDRGHNAAHNMARAALHWLRNSSWPEKLCRLEN
ncbi:hypothetical protein BGZ46_003780 [Entomortierella lignicola]|nr:hypothetical protein BGZ46_003780 [Entomortierella lignicola]